MAGPGVFLRSCVFGALRHMLADYSRKGDTQKFLLMNLFGNLVSPDCD
jgi:hypothetical protein